MATTWSFYTQRPRPTGNEGGILSGEGYVSAYDNVNYESVLPVARKFKELWSMLFISEYTTRVFSFTDAGQHFSMSQDRNMANAILNATCSFHWIATGLMHPEGD